MRPCLVHHHATGGEILTIGLYPRDGQTAEQCYAEWRLRCGKRCTCEPESVLVQAYDPLTGEKVGRAFESKLHLTQPQFSVRITNVKE